MIDTLFNALMYIMPVLAVIVFIALFFVKAGYGIFHTKSWGLSLPNKVGWVIMECPAFILMAVMWLTGQYSMMSVPAVFFILFEIHYFQRAFVFPLLMKGKSKMPVSIMLMGVVFNLINGFLIGYSLFDIHCRDGDKSSFGQCDKTSSSERRYKALFPAERNVPLCHFCQLFRGIA